jgi:hypothetical protein
MNLLFIIVHNSIISISSDDSKWIQNDGGFCSGHGASIPPLSSQSSAPQYSYGGHHGTSKKIEIPNGRVSFL